MTKSKAGRGRPEGSRDRRLRSYIKSTPKPGEIEANLASIRDLAKSQGYPDVLIDGMFKRGLEIVRAARPRQERQAPMTRGSSRRESTRRNKAATVERLWSKGASRIRGNS